MKIEPRSALTFVAPLFLAFVPAADELRFDPKPGIEVGKKLDVNLELSVDDVSLEMNGQPLPPEAIGQLQDMTINLGVAVAVTEKLAGVKDGHATDLLRTFDTVKVKAEAGNESKDESIDKMEGKTVRFLWDDKKSEYTKSWHECTGEDNILEALSPDMEVSALLPEKKVSKGDKWEVAGSKVLSLILPGVQQGSIDLSKASMGGAESKAAQIMIDEIGPQLEEAIKHLKVACEYQGSHEAEGQSLADVKLHMEGEIKIDLGPMFERIAEEESQGMKPDITAKVSLEIKGDGTLSWNAATRMLQTYELDADLTLKLDADAQMNQGGQDMKFHAAIGVGGKGSWKLASTKH